MKLATHNYTGARKFAATFPKLALLDFLGLAIAGWSIAVQVFGEQAQTFLVVIAAAGVIAWLFVAQFKSLVTVLTKSDYRMLAVPTLAVLLAAVTLEVLQANLSYGALLFLLIFWTAWMAGMRLLYRRNFPVLRTLVIGTPGFYRDLARLPALDATRFEVPPDRFHDFDVVVIDPVKTYDNEWLQWLSHADMAGVKIIAAPLVFETLEKRIPLQMLHGRWAYNIFSGHSGYAFWKRLLDVMAVVLAAPLLLLLNLVVALVVLLDSGRPILFWQKRVGKDGKLFNMVKFRTMQRDAEDNGAAFAAEHDPRVTKIGAFLRRYRLDEIPQFYNVLKGEMSVIGPRPEQERFANQFVDEIPLYRLRYNVSPGITGWAQVNNGYAAGTAETEEKLRYDFYYIKYFSFELDVHVVLRTIRIIFTGFGAR